MRKKPHINFGIIGETSFCSLSQQAQKLIVRAAVGEFNDTPPPEIPDAVKAEIAQWASEPDDGGSY